jgi:hypothetical protein
VLVDAEHPWRHTLGLMRHPMRVALMHPAFGRCPREVVALLDARKRVAVLVPLDDLFLELLGRALVRQHAGHALPEVATATAAPLRHVHDQPVRSHPDARVPDAALDQVLAPMRAIGLAARARRLVAQLA